MAKCVSEKDGLPWIRLVFPTDAQFERYMESFLPLYILLTSLPQVNNACAPGCQRYDGRISSLGLD